MRALARDVVGAEDTVEDDHGERTLLQQFSRPAAGCWSSTTSRIRNGTCCTERGPRSDGSSAWC